MKKTQPRARPSRAADRQGRARSRYSMLLILGAGILVAGGVLLLWTLGYIPKFGPLWPLPVMIGGLVLLYLAYRRGWPERWIIPGMVLSLGGLVLLLLNTVLKTEGLARVWPLLMLATGLSLIPYGFKKRGGARVAIIVPAVFLSALSLVFLGFSLRAGGGFTAFVAQWWPVILVMLGLALLVSFFTTRRPNSKT
jgi:hypothetical protein